MGFCGFQLRRLAGDEDCWCEKIFVKKIWDGLGNLGGEGDALSLTIPKESKLLILEILMVDEYLIKSDLLR